MENIKKELDKRISEAEKQMVINPSSTIANINCLTLKSFKKWILSYEKNCKIETDRIIERKNKALKSALKMLEQTSVFRDISNLRLGNVFLESTIKKAKEAIRYKPKEKKELLKKMASAGKNAAKAGFTIGQMSKASQRISDIFSKYWFNCEIRKLDNMLNKEKKEKEQAEAEKPLYCSVCGKECEERNQFGFALCNKCSKETETEKINKIPTLKDFVKLNQNYQEKLKKVSKEKTGTFKENPLAEYIRHDLTTLSKEIRQILKNNESLPYKLVEAYNSFANQYNNNQTLETKEYILKPSDNFTRFCAANAINFYLDNGFKIKRILIKQYNKSLNEKP